MSDYLTDRDPGDETQPRAHEVSPWSGRCRHCGRVADWCGGLAGPCIPEPDSE
jgi:hypothetical protein